jgi:hypothetical protein
MRKIFSLLAIVAALISAQAFANVVPVGQVVFPTATIPISTTTSNAISTNGMSLVGCQLPATMTGTSISFTVATTLAGTYQELDNASGKVTYTIAGGKFIAINPVDFYGVQFFKIVSGSSEAAARSLACTMKGI